MAFQEEVFGWDSSSGGFEPMSTDGEALVEVKCQGSVQGRLRSHSAFWLEELAPSKFVASS